MNVNTNIAELFLFSTKTETVDWNKALKAQHCGYLNRKCIKIRKSEPDISIGTCTVRYGKENREIIICPHRLIEKRQIFIDCIHLLTLHEPGNELHIVPEINIPGGNIDYFLASVMNKKVVDFVGIELQTLDTTGTVWSERQKFLTDLKIFEEQEGGSRKKPYHIKLNERLSTDGSGLASAMGLKAEAKVELEMIVKNLETKISENTLLMI